jgi:hypothetical protein
LSQFEVPNSLEPSNPLVGVASITSELYLYLLTNRGQRKFSLISFTSLTEPSDFSGRAAEISNLLGQRNRIYENISFSLGKWAGRRYKGAIRLGRSLA